MNDCVNIFYYQRRENKFGVRFALVMWNKRLMELEIIVWKHENSGMIKSACLFVFVRALHHLVRVILKIVIYDLVREKRDVPLK